MDQAPREHADTPDSPSPIAAATPETTAAEGALDAQAVDAPSTPSPEAAPTAAADAVERPEAPASAPAEAAPVEAAESAAKAPEASSAKAEPGMGELMAKGGPATLAEPKVGAKVKGRIVKIGEDAAFVDFGGREEAALDLREIRDPDGKLTRKVGDEVRGAITVVEGGVRISLKGARSLPKNLPLLKQAVESGVPVEGKVTSVNKGGLVVHTMGVRAFCPFSQVDRHYVDDTSVFVGRKLSFRVVSADDKGRNVVLSRRSLLEEQAKANAEEVRAKLEVNQVVKGVVARIRPFGAFVDLGGIDGLLHVSEMSYQRVTDPSDVLKVGQEIEVKIRSIENLGTKNERIGLSLKQLQEDPWEVVARGLQVGGRVKAKVVRLAPFGAFMELAPGVDGLAHVSTLAEGHVAQPSDVISVGDEVEPWVVSVDSKARRISLSLVEPTGEERGGFHEGRGEGRDRPRRDRDRDDRRGPRRDSGPREHRTGPVGTPGMTSMEEAFERLRSQQDR